VAAGLAQYGSVCWPAIATGTGWADWRRRGGWGEVVVVVAMACSLGEGRSVSYFR